MKLILNKGQRLWFTSDTHYHHANICKSTTRWTNPETIRDFSSLEEMDTALVDNINEYVKEDDILFHLGDWSFGGADQISIFRDRIKCKNVHLVLGNHDQHVAKASEGYQSLFSSVNKYVELSVKWPNEIGDKHHQQTFVLMHFPIASWNDMARGTIHLHGHVHFNPNIRLGKGKMIDVGVDGNNLYPVSMEEILDIMKQQPIKSLFNFDHHEKVENYK